MAYLLGTPTTVVMNTAATGDLGADGFTWAQGSPLVVDEFGKLIAWAQAVNGGNKRFIPVVSNDLGVTWSEPTHTGFGPDDNNGEYLGTRCAQAYDATNHLLHVIWVSETVNFGAIYRQYSFTRSSNNITGITRVRGFQIEIGVAGMLFEAPVALWCADVGKLLIGWSARSATKSEYRLTCRTISNTATDVDTTAWVAPFNTTSTDTMGSAFQAGGLLYNTLAKSATAKDIFLALFRKPAGAATHALDLVWVSTQGTAGVSGTLFFNRATWDGTGGHNDWRGAIGKAIANDDGLTSLGALNRGVTDAGYNLKSQVISKIAYDTVTDKLWVGISTWRGVDGVAPTVLNGDTWSLQSVSGADAAGGWIDAYATGAANTDVARDMFITGDVMYDVASGLVATSYTDLPRHDVYVATYDNGVASQAGVAVYTATPCDIPTIYDARVNSKLGLLFRDFPATFRNNPPTTALPYTGYYVSVPLAAQTAAAAATPTPSFLATAPGGLGTWRR